MTKFEKYNNVLDNLIFVIYKYPGTYRVSIDYIPKHCKSCTLEIGYCYCKNNIIESLMKIGLQTDTDDSEQFITVTQPKLYELIKHAAIVEEDPVNLNIYTNLVNYKDIDLLLNQIEFDYKYTANINIHYYLGTTDNIVLTQIWKPFALDHSYCLVCRSETYNYKELNENYKIR